MIWFQIEIEAIRNETNLLSNRVAIMELHPSTDVMDTNNLESLVQHAVEEAVSHFHGFGSFQCW